MRVRIRFGKGAQIVGKPRKNRRMAASLGALLTPVAAMAAVLGVWAVAADLGWTGAFAIATGLFSHWHVWFLLAAGLQTVAHLLHRYSAAGEPATPPDAGSGALPQRP